MPRSGVFLEAAISFYSNLAFNAVSDMRLMQEDLRTGNFQIDKAVGRALSLWLDAGEGWLSTLLATASEPLPTAFLRIGHGSRTDTRFVRVVVPETPALNFTGLYQSGGSGRIPAANVIIKRSSRNDGIEIKLKGLKGSEKAGLYQGLVHIGDKPLVLVMVHVEDD